MGSIFHGTLQDAEMIGNYLHDSLILDDDINLLEQDGKVSILVERIYYEKPKHIKILFLNFYRYPTIESSLVFTNAKIDNLNHVDEKLNTFGEQHRLLENKLEDKNKIIIVTEHLEISIIGSQDSEIIIKDISEPSERLKVTDFVKPIFCGLDEFNKLKRA